MKKRRYADGGLVVSRGYDAGLGNIRLTDMPDLDLRRPSAAAAADRMAQDDIVSSRPSVEELQAANLRAVREREARETAPLRRAPARETATKKAPPVASGMSDAEIRRFMRENDEPRPAPRKKADETKPVRKEWKSRAAEYVDTVKEERSRARAANQAKVEKYIREGRLGTAKMFAAIAEGADYDAAMKKLGMVKPKPSLASGAVNSRVGLMQQRPPTLLAMKKGGSVKKTSMKDMMKPVWEKPAPKGKPKPLTSAQKSSAKAAAKKAGRPYPNLVDNMRASRKAK